jgi:hypothetical protein
VNITHTALARTHALVTVGREVGSEIRRTWKAALIALERLMMDLDSSLFASVRASELPARGV